MILFLSLSFALLLVTLIILIAAYARRRERIDLLYRLRAYTDTYVADYERQPISVQIKNFIKRSAEPLTKFRPIEEYNKLMKRAGIPITGAEYVTILLVAMVTIIIVTFMLTLNFYYSLILAMIIDFIIIGLVNWRVKRRLAAFTNQLSECIMTLADSLKAGFSFGQVMETVAREMEPPISLEFARASRNVIAGVSIEEAIIDISERIGSKDFDLAVAAIMIQREIGGDLGKILFSISNTIDGRVKMRQEMWTLTAQSRSSVKVVAALPILIIGGMYFFNPEYLDFFKEDQVGKIAAMASVVFNIIGIYVISRITDLDA